MQAGNFESIKHSVDSSFCAMRTSRSAASLHSKHLTPPPTDRLWLNLNNPSTASSRTTPQPSLHSSHTTTTTATANIHFNNFNNAPIRPLILSKTQMTQDKWHRLQIQTKVLEQLDMRTADSNKRATAILSMFRACNPDEFGLIHLHTFQPYFSQTFALTPHEAGEMFQIGDVKQSNELDYASFRSIFVSIDTDYKALQPPPHRGGLKKINAPGSQTDNTDGMHQSEHTIVQGMPKEARKRYLQHKRVQTLIDEKLRFVEIRFLVKEPMQVGMQESMIRTKLTYGELYQALGELGMNMEGLNAQELYTMFEKNNKQDQTVQQPQQHQMLQQNHSVASLMRQQQQQQQRISNDHYPQQQQQEARIGFSELIKANDLYFSLLGSSMEAIENKRQYTKLHDVYGRRLGRRKVGHGPGASGHLSQPGFLAHDDGRLGISSPDAIDRIGASALLHSSQSTSSLPQHAALNNSIGSTGMTRIQHSWKDPSVVAGLATKSNAQALFVPLAGTGCMPRYDEAFNDPAKHLWEQRWFDKSCPDRKRKLAKKALLGNNDLAQKQNHNMFARLTFHPHGEGEESQQQQHYHQQQPQQTSVIDANSRPWATGLNWSES